MKTNHFMPIAFALLIAGGKPSAQPVKQESPETNSGSNVVLQNPGHQVTWNDVKLYLKPGAKLYTVAPIENCFPAPPSQKEYTFSKEELEVLSDIAPIDFWPPSEAQTPTQLE